jgi:hypothetical protein
MRPSSKKRKRKSLQCAKAVPNGIENEPNSKLRIAIGTDR